MAGSVTQKGATGHTSLCRPLPHVSAPTHARQGSRMRKLCPEGCSGPDNDRVSLKMGPDRSDSGGHPGLNRTFLVKKKEKRMVKVIVRYC